MCQLLKKFTFAVVIFLIFTACKLSSLEQYNLNTKSTQSKVKVASCCKIYLLNVNSLLLCYTEINCDTEITCAEVSQIL